MNQTLNCFHCGEEPNRDTDYVQSLLRDREDKDTQTQSFTPRVSMISESKKLIPDRSIPNIEY